MKKYKVVNSRLGYKVSKGFWSGERVVCNPTEDSICILSHLNSHGVSKLNSMLDSLQEWVVRKFLPEYFLDWFTKAKYFGPLCLNELLAERQYSWSQVRTIVAKKRDKDQKKYAQELAEAWWKINSDSPSSAIVWGEIHRLPVNLSPLSVMAIGGVNDSLPTILIQLLALSQQNYSLKRFTGYSRITLSEQEKLFAQRIPAQERSMAYWMIPPLSKADRAKPFCGGYRNAVQAALAILIWLRKHGLIALPMGMERVKPWIADLELWSELLSTTKKSAQRAVAAGLHDLLLSSSINELDDIPEDIFKIYSLDNFKPGFSRRMLSWLLHPGTVETREPFPVDNFVLAQNSSQVHKWSPEWVRKNLPGEWQEFVDVWWMHEASDNHKITVLQNYLEWAWDYRKFMSPWDVQMADIRNIHKPKQAQTYFKFLQQKNVKDKHPLWSNSKRLYQFVCQVGNDHDSPIVDLAAIHNPFEGINRNPFKKIRGSSGKTTKGRIPVTVHEAFMEVLLDCDQNGDPQFRWAKDAFPDLVTITDPDNVDKMITTWCPSRATCLAILFGLPLRGVQARWLDQGLMDQEYYSISSGELRENVHSLNKFRYENGLDHYEQYGRASGVLQSNKSLLSDDSGRCIFINTNKTQLWNNRQKVGYEIPWPDGNELLHDSSAAIRAQGRWLSRVYKILEYQMAWMEKYDPVPHPLTFTHVPEDRSRATGQKDVDDFLPWFVPLFRDLHPSKVKTINLHGRNYHAYPPISKAKIEALFDKLAAEVERRLCADGADVKLTVTDTAGKPRCIFRIHATRVAMISRLCELGISIDVIADCFSGHASRVMAAYYIVMQQSHVREQLVAAAMNMDGEVGIGALVRELKQGVPMEAKLARSPQFKGHWDNIPGDSTGFAQVPGGICPKGGGGDGCQTGGVYENVDNDENVKVEYGPVKGGCGNCRFFLTGPDFLIPQALAINDLMLRIMLLGEKVEPLYEQLLVAEQELMDLSSSEDGRRMNLSFRIREISDTKQMYEESLVNLFSEWTSRIKLLNETEQLGVEKGDEVGSVLNPASLAMYMSKVEECKTSKFGLVRTIVEQCRLLGNNVAPRNSEAEMMLLEGVDTILHEESPGKLLLPIRDKVARTTAASIVAGFLADEFGDQKIQQAIEGRQPLMLSTIQNEKLCLLTEEVIKKAQQGELLCGGSVLLAEVTDMGGSDEIERNI